MMPEGRKVEGVALSDYAGFLELAEDVLNIPPSSPRGSSYVIDMKSLLFAIM